MSKVLKPWVVNLKKYGGYVLAIIIAGGIYYGVTHSAKKVNVSQKLDQISVAAPFKEEDKTTSNHLTLPDFNNPVGSGTSIKFEIMAWNAQSPLMYANGGVRTSKNSLFQQNGIDCEIVRQDDCNQMIKDFVENANQLANNKTKTPLILCLMGDGLPGFSSGLNTISKLKGHKVIAFYVMGRSNGEDCFWGPIDWKTHPDHCLGKSVVGVEKDGDMNIVLKWCSDNGININVNTKVYDSFALNVIPCSDFNTDLCAKVLGNYLEDRDVVSNGVTVPSIKHKLTIDAFTTWTPADVTIATKMGGFARLASTKEYSMQMPCVCIIDAFWAESHNKEMCDIIKSLGMAGDQIRSFPDAQEFAAKVSAKVYNEKDANYWLKYYRGCEELDKKGNKVFLGGSQSFNLADAAMMLGLGNEKTTVNRYKITYETFGSILTKLYPKDMEGMISFDNIFDDQYIRSVLKNNDTLKNGKTETNQYAQGSIVTEQVSEKSYNIKFALGSSIIDKSSYNMLNDIYNSAQISSGLTIFIYGFSSKIGADDANQILSEKRANAVADYLKNKGLAPNRIQTKGFGANNTLPNTDPSDQKNQRVEIIQGQ
jgi:outer membrane protein OmpA-like peptidoglycan-associated protein